MDEANWGHYVEHARQYIDSGRIEEEELGYKRVVERALKGMRDALAGNPDVPGDGALAGDGEEGMRDALAGNPDWAGAWGKETKVRRWIDNLCDWRAADHLENWFRTDPRGSRDALGRLWAPRDLSRGPGGQPVSDEEVIDRIRAFAPRMPDEIKGRGTRMRPISVLLMALGAERCPPFKTKEFTATYARLGHPRPARGSDEAGLYKHALRFLDRFIDEARRGGLDRPADRLEAQSVVWALRNQFAARKED